MRQYSDLIQRKETYDKNKIQSPLFIIDKHNTETIKINNSFLLENPKKSPEL